MVTLVTLAGNPWYYVVFTVSKQILNMVTVTRKMVTWRVL